VDANLLMTFCDQYPILLDQIASRVQLIDSNQEEGDDRDLWDEAVADWYDQVYLPVVRVIRELGVLHHFPERTEADMYVLLSERRDELERDLGWHVDMETGVSDLIVSQDRPRDFLSRVVKPLPPALRSRLAPGLWRQQQMARQRYHHLFEHMLVPLDGTEASWQMFDQVLELAKLDKDHILGLHVVPDSIQVDSQAVRRMRARFQEGCSQAGLQGEFAVEVEKSPVQSIIKRAAWVDLVVVKSPRPPANKSLARVRAGLKFLVQKCPRPIVVRPEGSQADFSRSLLAYDGSPKADEALFIATYLAVRWPISLMVVTVETEHTNRTALERAQRYLEQHEVTDVNYVLRQGPIAEMVLETAATYQSNQLFMGGFSFRSLRQLTLGSSAERVLREFPHPVWICR
jgi:nucleotide-binding universal stress UspA family protein